MKPLAAFTSLALIFVLSLGGAGCAHLKSTAQITREQAEGVALHHTKGGAVKSSELENEHGKLIWSVDVKKHGTKNITEVAVDAKTGAIVAVEIETPAEQAAEAKVDAAKKQ